MQLVQRVLCTASLLYTFALIANIILSWFPVGEESPWFSASSFALRITDPLLGLLRGRIPPVSVGAASFDTSFLIFFFVFAALIPGILGCTRLT